MVGPRLIGSDQIQNRSRLDHHRREAVQQAVAGRGVNKVDAVELSGSAVETSPNIVAIQRPVIVVNHVVNRNTLYLRTESIEAWHRTRGCVEIPCMRWRKINTAILTPVTWLGRCLENAVMPNACVFCGGHCQVNESPVCNPCYDNLPWNNRACYRCANPVSTDLPQGIACAACQESPPPFTATVVPLLYEFPVDAAIKAMKFKRRLFYVPAFADILTQAMHDIPADVDALLPVPLHWRRQAFRGFNQASEVADRVSRTTGLPVLKNVRRHRATPFQSGLVAAHRRRNLRAAFAVRGETRARHVLIVDDVITTGETCRQLALTLLDAGVGKVSVLAIARA